MMRNGLLWNRCCTHYTRYVRILLHLVSQHQRQCFELQIESSCVDTGSVSFLYRIVINQICLSLLLNNSVDLFSGWTTSQTVRRSSEDFDSDIHFIIPPAHLFFQLYLFYAEVTEPRLLRSSILPHYALPPINPPPLQQRADFFFDKSSPKSLHFYSYKYRFRAPCSPSDTKPEWPFD